MKQIFILLILILFSKNLLADDIIQTLSAAFKNNSKLNAQRANLNASKQDVNISRGDFLPSITLSGDRGTQKNTNRKNLVEFRYKIHIQLLKQINNCRTKNI